MRVCDMVGECPTCSAQRCAGLVRQNVSLDCAMAHCRARSRRRGVQHRANVRRAIAGKPRHFGYLTRIVVPSGRLEHDGRADKLAVPNGADAKGMEAHRTMMAVPLRHCRVRFLQCERDDLQACNGARGWRYNNLAPIFAGVPMMIDTATDRAKFGRTPLWRERLSAGCDHAQRARLLCAGTSAATSPHLGRTVQDRTCQATR